MFGGILIDLDGTLVDSQKDIDQAMKLGLSDIGIEIEIADLGELKGAHMSLVLAHFLGKDVSEVPKEKIDDYSGRYRDHYLQTMFNSTTLYPVVKETLAGLSSVEKAIATSKPIQYALMLIEHFDLGKYFKVIQGCESLPPKPAPDVFLEAARKLEVDPVDCLAVGDTALDIKSASAAGCKTCLVDYTSRYLGNEDWKPDYIVQNFEEIKEIVKSVSPQFE